LITLLAFSACAQDPLQSLWGSGDPLAALAYSGPAAGRIHGSAERVTVQGPGFTNAIRMRTDALPSDAGAADEGVARLHSTGRLSLNQGDVIRAELCIRCAQSSTGECATRLLLQTEGPEPRRIASRSILATRGWARLRFRMTAGAPAQPGAYSVDFLMAQQVQTVEIAAISLTRHPPGTALADLGIAEPYEGAAEDAPWRKAASDRIERIRKAPITITATDAAGQPVRGAKVRVSMKRHAFAWGTAISAALLLAATPDAERYRKTFLENFNAVVFENDLKWPQWERNPKLALDGIEWMRTHGITRIRGHNLVWPGWRWLPRDLPALAGDKQALRNRVDTHFADILSATHGRLAEWDVLNEPYSQNDLIRILGEPVMADWFRLAKRHAPGVRLYINDFGILSDGGAGLMHINHYDRTIQSLLAAGAPVEGIGLQGHFGSPTPPQRMLDILDRFARFGKPLAITEFDFEVDDQNLQAQFTRDLLTVCFSHPSVSQFLMWGFWEGRHWKPRGAMINRTWDPKPNYRVWRELVFRRWWTDETLVTDDAGRIQLRGFLGQYSLNVSHPTGVHDSTFDLARDGANLTVRLKPSQHAAAQPF